MRSVAFATGCLLLVSHVNAGASWVVDARSQCIGGSASSFLKFRPSCKLCELTTMPQSRLQHRHKRLQEVNFCGRCRKCKEVAHSILSTTARSGLAFLFYRRLKSCVELNECISKHQLWCDVCLECGIAGDATEKTSHCDELRQWRFYKAVEQLEKIEMDNLLANCVCHSCSWWWKKFAQDDLGKESWYNFFRGRLRRCGRWSTTEVYL